MAGQALTDQYERATISSNDSASYKGGALSAFVEEFQLLQKRPEIFSGLVRCQTIVWCFSTTSESRIVMTLFRQRYSKLFSVKFGCRCVIFIFIFIVWHGRIYLPSSP